jgi:Flp pilus assembly pilin Flp
VDARAKQRTAAWLADETGSALVEYIFILALIAVVAMGATSFLGSAIRRQFDIASVVLQWSGSGDPLPPAVWKQR